MDRSRLNWAGNYSYGAARIHRPKTLEEAQELVTGCRKVKALGTRHSFNNIADCAEDMISLEHFDEVISLDRERRQVKVGAGIRYGWLCQHLENEGFALHNLASLPHISVAGACATATHGSGDSNGNLSTAVAGMELVKADGTAVTLSSEQDGELFQAVVVGLGALGVVTKLTLDVVPSFMVRQDVYENLPLAQVESRFDEIVSSAYSVSLFTDWLEARFNQVWFKRRVTGDEVLEAEPELFGATLATKHLHPLASLSAENCTAQMGIPGPWFERMPHFRMDFTPSAGEELQTEYLVPRRHILAAIHAVYGLGDRIAPLLLITEIRTIAADSLWMSPCYGQACVGIHFTWKKDWDSVGALLPLIEERLAPFEARPHWGKLFTMEPQRVQSLYEKLPEFREVAESFDPDGKFRNAFLDRYVFGAE